MSDMGEDGTEFCDNCGQLFLECDCDESDFEDFDDRDVSESLWDNGDFYKN